MLKETASAVGTAFVFSPFGLPIVAHGLAGLLVGTATLHVVNGVINDVKEAGQTLRRAQNQPAESQGDDQE